MADRYKELKKDALNRKRRIIFDNDGGDVIYGPKDKTVKSMLNNVMEPLKDTQVDSVSLSTMSSGFGQFTHLTEKGVMFTLTEKKFKYNFTKYLAERNTDHLKISIDFCRKNKMEVFWQLRMNDTHDGSENWYGPLMFKTNTIKRDHPQYLLSSPNCKPKCGAWSAVNYALPEIRNLALSFIEEILDNYDIDGINLDFFRHPIFFKSTSECKKASQEEMQHMTDLIRRVSLMMEEKGREKNKALLLAVRVPDSVEYSKTIGLDIEEWMKNGYIDILITSSYFQLNNWEYSVTLGHKYGVKVYPSLDEIRIKERYAKNQRQTLKCYRARAMNAFSSGADGIYLFNYKPRDIEGFSGENIVAYNEIGAVETLSGKPKTYFASYRGVGEVANGGYPHLDYINIPVLNPCSKIFIDEGGEAQISVFVGETCENPAVGLRIKTAKQDIPKILINDTELYYCNKIGKHLIYRAQKPYLRNGENNVKIKLERTSGELLDLKIDVC